MIIGALCDVKMRTRIDSPQNDVELINFTLDKKYKINTEIFAQWLYIKVIVIAD